MLDRIYKIAQIIAAFATAILAFLTISLVKDNRQYVKLTSQLVLQQQDPDVRLGLSPPGLPHDLIIHNYGPQRIVDAQLWWTAYMTDNQGKQIASFYSAQPSPAVPHSWWEIQALDVGKEQSKPLADVIDNVGHNAEVTRDAMNRVPKGRNLPPRIPASPVTRIVFFVQYRREVDHKSYQTQIEGGVMTDANTGKFFMSDQPELPALPTPQK